MDRLFLQHNCHVTSAAKISKATSPFRNTDHPPASFEHQRSVASKLSTFLNALRSEPCTCSDDQQRIGLVRRKRVQPKTVVQPRPYSPMQQSRELLGLTWRKLGVAGIVLVIHVRVSVRINRICSDAWSKACGQGHRLVNKSTGGLKFVDAWICGELFHWLNTVKRITAAGSFVIHFAFPNRVVL